MENNNKEKLIDYLPDDGNIRLKWWNKFLIKELGKKEKEKKKLIEEIGKLNAYIDELKHEKKSSQSKELGKQQTSNKEKNETIKELRKDKNYLQGQIKTCQKIIKQKEKIIKRYEENYGKISESSSNCIE